MKKTKPSHLWAGQWLDSVADSTYAMSQRRMTSIEKKGGGLEVIKTMDKKRGIHLLQLEDDRGIDLIAASLKSFKVIC